MSVQETNLKAIADAIREKDGSTKPIPASTFPERIRAIPAGGLPEELRTITVETSDPNKGSVSGGGQAMEGAMIAVVAQSISGNKFMNWKENENIVSTNPLYNFTVIKSQHLVATFVPSRLPAGYVEVEYIEADGAQYIDTGLIPSTSFSVISDVYPTNSNCYVFGSTFPVPTQTSTYVRFSVFLLLTILFVLCMRSVSKMFPLHQYCREFQLR